MANWEFEGEGGEAKSGLMGLLAMSQNQYGVEVGPDGQSVVIDADDGSILWYGDRGDGTVEALALVGIAAMNYIGATAVFGTNACDYTGVFGLSKSLPGVGGHSVSGSGVMGTSVNNYGGYFLSYMGSNGAYIDPSIHIENICSALQFVDRTPFYEGDALKDIKKIKGKKGSIDHSTLPSFAKVINKVRHVVNKGKVGEKPVFGEEVEEEGRDLGAMISILTVGIQQLTQRVEALEKK
jgi:hypothetical protein